MDDVVLIWITRVLLFTFVIGLLTFVGSYFLRSNWRGTMVGRYFLYFMTTMALLFLYILLAPTLVHFHGRFYLNIVICLILNYGAWKMTLLLLKIQKGEEVNKMREIRFPGREPALIIAVVTATVNWAVGFGFGNLTADRVSWINVVVNAIAGCIAAWATKPIAPQAFTYAVTSVFGLLTAYGLHFSGEQVSTTQMLVLTVLALITRGQVSPTVDAPNTGVLGDKVTTE